MIPNGSMLRFVRWTDRSCTLQRWRSGWRIACLGLRIVSPFQSSGAIEKHPKPNAALNACVFQVLRSSGGVSAKR